MRLVVVALVLVQCVWISRNVRAEQAPATISSAAELRRLCLQVEPTDSLQLSGNAFERGQKRAAHRRNRDQALQRLYIVELPATAFELLEYDIEAEELEVDTSSGLNVAGDATVLAFADDAPMRTAVVPARAREIAQLHQQRTLRLRFGFYLRNDIATASPCSWNRLGRRVLTVQAEVGFFELRPHRGGPLVRVVYGDISAGHGADAAGAGRGSNARPTVTLSAPSANANTAALAQLFRGEVGAQIRQRYLGCYRRRAETQANIEGTIVVSFTIGRAGHVSAAHVEIDSVGDRQLGACVLQQTRGFQFPRSVWGTVSLPVNFDYR